MRNGLRQSMAWLHTWAGLVAGWLLFAIFVSGTATYYRDDISRWMRPEQLARAQTTATLANAADVAGAVLTERAPNALAWFIRLPKANDPTLDLYWMKSEGDFDHARIDPETGKPPTVRETKGGDFFYNFHFELMLPSVIGRWIVGACAMIALVAILSGIITHRRIFADFFTFRRTSSPQRGWLDAHNVTGVLALPFHLMITYTGIVTLAVMYMPWGVTVAYKGDEVKYFAATRQIVEPRMPSGEPGTLAPLGAMVTRALAAIPEELETLYVTSPSDAAAKVVAVFEEPRGLSHQHPQVAFDGSSGTMMETLRPGAKPAVQTFTTMVGLHEAHFAGPALRVLFFVCGLMGSAMIATGLVLWTVARLPKRGEERRFGLRLVQALNVGTVAGMPVAVAGFFLANRLLPVELAARANWEVGAFFAVWIAVAAYGAARPHRRAWREVFYAAAAAFAAVPVVNALTTDRNPLASLASGDALFPWFDAAMLALALLFAFSAAKVGGVSVPRRLSGAAQGEHARPVSA